MNIPSLSSTTLAIDEYSDLVIDYFDDKTCLMFEYLTEGNDVFDIDVIGLTRRGKDYPLMAVKPAGSPTVTPICPPSPHPSPIPYSL